MANVIIDNTHLTNIADAIREKTGTSDTYKPGEMATAIQAIEAGSGGGDIPEEAYKLITYCQYRFAYGGWDWFIKQCGDKITTENLLNCSAMFESSNVEEIPFDINLGAAVNTSLNSLYSNAKQLKQLPTITSTITNFPTSSYNFIGIESIFNSLYNVREIPYDYLTHFVPEGYWEKKASYMAYGTTSAFKNCYSLRNIPNIFPFANFSNDSTYSSCYRQAFYYCYSLDEITDLYVEPAQYTSNAFDGTFERCHRLKDMTFALQDGAPQVVEWKNQTINLNLYVGYSYTSNGSTITGFNSGITADKEVKDDATYQALKNDPDWFSCKVAYSRYNHDSAVNTINSLPDTSAYGTNTIKFKGASGELTDGGAINTLTDEEIAVAAAKGWTVSLT